MQTISKSKLQEEIMGTVGHLEYFPCITGILNSQNLDLEVPNSIYSFSSSFPSLPSPRPRSLFLPLPLSLLEKLPGLPFSILPK